MKKLVIMAALVLVAAVAWAAPQKSVKGAVVVCPVCGTEVARVIGWSGDSPVIDHRAKCRVCWWAEELTGSLFLVDKQDWELCGKCHRLPHGDK